MQPPAGHCLDHDPLLEAYATNTTLVAALRVLAACATEEGGRKEAWRDLLCHDLPQKELARLESYLPKAYRIIRQEEEFRVLGEGEGVSQHDLMGLLMRMETNAFSITNNELKHVCLSVENERGNKVHVF